MAARTGVLAKGGILVESYIVMEKWWSYLVRGLLAIAFGVVLLVWPASTVRVLTLLIGIFALVDGVIETVLAIVLAARKEKMGIVLVRGLVSLLIGILLLAKTGFALALVVVILAIWAIVSGFVELIVAFELPPMSGRSLIGIFGVISIIFGILLIALPLETVYGIIVVLSIFLILGGLMRVIYSFFVRKYQEGLESS